MQTGCFVNFWKPIPVIAMKLLGEAYIGAFVNSTQICYHGYALWRNHGNMGWPSWVAILNEMITFMR